MKYKIGVGITSHNRRKVFNETLKKMKSFLPSGAKLVIVDDGSDDPVKGSSFRFEKAQGIAIAKNKCLELLDDCDYIFLFDDDIYPRVKGWYLPYIESGINHMQYSFNTFSNGRRNGRVLEKNDDKFNYWVESCGCMLFYTKKCLEVVGGMDPGFGVWGYEHISHSVRIHYAGLTPHPFMDLKNSSELFYSMDWDQTTDRSVAASVRSSYIPDNKRKYEYERNLKLSHFIPYKPLNSIVLTCYFTGVPDPQRGVHFQKNIEPVLPLLKSTYDKGCSNVVVLNDCIKDQDWSKTAKFVTHVPYINPYFERWFAIHKYLTDHPEVDQVFCVDATDVEMNVNPFMFMRSGALYVGDEPSKINNLWLKKHHKHPIFNQMYMVYGQRQLFNAGLLGGFREEVMKFCVLMMDFYSLTKGYHQLTDMAALNYLLYIKYGVRNVISGRQVNTVFKAYDTENKTSWFKHK